MSSKRSTYIKRQRKVLFIAKHESYYTNVDKCTEFQHLALRMICKQLLLEANYETIINETIIYSGLSSRQFSSIGTKHQPATCNQLSGAIIAISRDWYLTNPNY